MDWHESCRKADIVFFDNGRSCLSCGAVAPECTSSPLPPIRQLAEIRILSLKFGSASEPIVCDVFTKDLATYPEYEAISYTWADESGDAAKSRTIQVSGKSFGVTANCENALRRARRRFTDRNIWIDAVCIDQDNVEERGHQVGLMPRIYAGAKHVLVYVGEATEHSTAAVASITRGPIRWEPFLGLMSRRYFTRAWTLQEVALARKATLLCGEDSLPWALLARRIRTITPSTFDPPQTRDILMVLPPQLSFDYTLYSSPGHVLTLLDFGRRSQAADPRDKVFSLLGLMPGGRMGDIEADYSMDTCRLYTKVAEYLAAQHGWMAVLARAGTDRSSIVALPSWVPDWSHGCCAAPPELSRLPFHPYANAICDAGGKTLIIKLLVLGSKAVDFRYLRRTTEFELNVHWDSYIAQRTQTHIWSLSLTSLKHIATPCIDFLTHLLNTTDLAVGQDTFPSIITHQTGFVDLMMKYPSASSESGSPEFSFEGMRPTFGTHALWGVPIQTAAQIFTMTIAEMVHLDIFSGLVAVPDLPNTPSEEEHANADGYLEAVLLHSRAVLASGAPLAPALANFWSAKYHAGELAGVEARNRSSLRITACVGWKAKVEATYTTTNVTAAEMESGLWSTHHPLFAEANEVLWKLFLHQHLYREMSVTVC